MKNKLHSNSSIDYQRFDMNLEKIIRDRKMKFVDVACAIGTTRETVSNWVHGRKFPYLGYLMKISKYLDVSLDELVEGVVIDD